MEREIGEIFEHNGEWYQCVKGDCCRNCDFYDKFKDDICFAINNCSLSHRSDKTSVIFKKLKRLGEPYIIGNKLIQRYKIYPTTFNINVYGWYYQNLDVQSWTIDIEIKQAKEDMEEKKIHLKPFDLEAAKAGKPVCTRDGRKARIICFDTKGDKPIIALIEYEIDERPCNYFANGRFYSNPNENNDADLMMLPEKKEGWVNIYDDMRIYASEEGAKTGISPERTYITTTKVKWEE